MNWLQKIAQMSIEQALSMFGYNSVDVLDPMQLKKDWKKLMMQWHPDRNQGSPESEEKTKQINQAYDVLNTIEMQPQQAQTETWQDQELRKHQQWQDQQAAKQQDWYGTAEPEIDELANMISGPNKPPEQRRRWSPWRGKQEARDRQQAIDKKFRDLTL